MTDHTTRDPDTPPDGCVWCVKCGVHFAQATVRNTTKCPICNPAAYARFRMDPFVAPGMSNANTPTAITFPSTRAEWTPTEENECSPSETPASAIPASVTTPTADNAAVTGLATGWKTRLTRLSTRRTSS